MPCGLSYYELADDADVCVTDELLAEKEKYKGISEELDETFTELAEY